MSRVRRNIFSARVSELGAQMASAPDDSVTHFVVGSSISSDSFQRLGYAVHKCAEVVTDAWLVESLTKCEKVSTAAYQHSKRTHDSTSHLMPEFDKEWVLEYPLLEASAQKRRKTDHGPVPHQGDNPSPPMELDPGPSREGPQRGGDNNENHD